MKGTSILGNGKIIKLMGMESILQKAVIIRVIFLNLSKMEKVFSPLKTETSIKVFTKMEIPMDRVNIFGKTAQSTKAISFKALDMAKVNGPVQMVIIIKVNLKMIRKMVMVFLIGKMEINIKGNLLMM